MAPPTTSLQSSSFKNVTKLPMKKVKVRFNTKREYRLKKCEMTAELLFKLWNKKPSDYNFEHEVKASWQQHISPMVQFGHLPRERAENDMHLHIDI